MASDDAVRLASRRVVVHAAIVAPGGPSGGVGELIAFLRDHRSEILADLEVRLRAIPTLRQRPATELVDHLPQVLDRVRHTLEALARGEPVPEDGSAAVRHADQRAEEGLEVSDFVAEYATLRRTLVLSWAAKRGLALDQLLLLDTAIEAVLDDAVVRFAERRERTFRALDRVSEAVLESDTLDELLHRLLAALVDSVDAADVAVIFLRDGDRLVVRAAVGLTEEVERGFSLAIGEGFTGRIAAERRAGTTRSASEDPMVLWPALRRAGLRALHGVPLVADDELIGVAHMGSRTLAELDRQDRRVFRAMVDRARAGIIQHRLRDELRRTAAWQQRLIGILGHDLRTPLGAILLSAQALLRRDDVPHHVTRALLRTESAAQRMARMIDDVVDWTRGQLGAGVPVHRQPVDLTALCERVVAEVEAGHPDRVVVVDSQGVTTGAWDPERLAQLVQNLVGNALQHATPGTPVRVSVRGADGAVELEVHNSGPAIPPQVQARLFEPFFQAGEPGARGALGLGLYVVAEIVRAHGGTVDVRSPDGAGGGDGTTFAVRLPRA